MLPCKTEWVNGNSGRGSRLSKPTIVSGSHWKLIAQKVPVRWNRLLRTEHPRPNSGLQPPDSWPLPPRPSLLSGRGPRRRDMALTSWTCHTGLAATIPVQVVVVVTLLPAVSRPLRARGLQGQPWEKKERSSRPGHVGRGLTLTLSHPHHWRPPSSMTSSQTLHMSISPSEGTLRLREGRNVSNATQEKSADCPQNDPPASGPSPLPEPSPQSHCSVPSLLKTLVATLSLSSTRIQGCLPSQLLFSLVP